MKYILSLLVSILSSAYIYGLPSSPLTNEYTLTGTETIKDVKYTIDATGTLNIGSDTGGAGELIWQHTATSASQLLFTQNGTLNIGTDKTSGILRFVGLEAGKGAYLQTAKSAGTLNIGKLGEYIIEGYNINNWTTWSSMPKNTNLYGKITFTPLNQANGWIGVQNFNLYAGAYFYSTQCVLLHNNGSVWNLYDSGLDLVGGLRVGSESNYSNTLNLFTANTLDNVKSVMMNNANCTLNINVGNFDTKINKLRLTTSSTVNIKLPEIKSGNIFTFDTICTKDDVSNITGAKIAIEYFVNDYIEIYDSTDYSLSIVDNKLFISTKNSYVELVAYTGDKSGTAISGNWSLEDNGFGGYWLNNSAIPEPSAIAAIIGALALALAAKPKSRK